MAHVRANADSGWPENMLWWSIALLFYVIQVIDLINLTPGSLTTIPDTLLLFDLFCNDNKTPITAKYKLVVIIVIGAQPAESLSSIHSLGFFTCKWCQDRASAWLTDKEARDTKKPQTKTKQKKIVACTWRRHTQAQSGGTHANRTHARFRTRFQAKISWHYWVDT